MDKKRIVFTVTNDLVTDQRMIRICNSLQHAGYQVTLVGRLRSSSTELPKQVFKQHRLVCTYQSGPLFYLEFNLRLLFWLLTNTFDIYGAVDADTILPCTLASGIKQKKMVFDAHEYYTEVPELCKRPIVKAIWQQVLNACVSKAKLAYTVGGELANLFAAQFGIPFFVVHNMPVKKQYQVGDKPQKIVWYQGDLNEGRGLEETILACKGLPVQLHIAGDGLLKKQLTQLVEQHQLTNQVTFVGKIKPHELHAYTQRAWVGINVLAPQSLSYQYSIANKFFDYVQAHVPSICANFIEYQKLNAQHEVALLCGCTSNEIREKLVYLLNNETKYNQLVQNCAEAAKQWVWEGEEVKLLSLYQTVCNE